MPVDPILKQDLMLVKEIFERKALEQDGDAALVPVSSMLRSNQDVLINVRENVQRYPSYYARNIPDNQSTLERIQEECLPCADRIKELADVDIAPRIDDTLLVYNKNVLRQLVSIFKTLDGRNPVETHLCDLYTAMRAQCVPDLRRATAALTYLLNDVRGFKLKALKDNFLQAVLALLAGLVVNVSFDLDKFAQLITNTLKCTVQDIRVQLNKLSPILSKEELDRTVDQVRAAWRQNEEDRQWLESQGSQGLYRPLPPNEIPFNNALTTFESKAADKIKAATDLSKVVEGQFKEAIELVDNNLIGARQELIKLLKANGDDLKILHELVEQIQIIQGILNILKALVESRGSYDPCGTGGDEVEEGKRFFTRVKIPGADIIVEPRPEGDPTNPDDIDITIRPDTTLIDNPVVRDILEDAGIPTRRLESGDVIVDATPVTISLFDCLGKDPIE